MTAHVYGDISLPSCSHSALKKAAAAADNSLYVIIISMARFRVNLHSIVA